MNHCFKFSIDKYLDKYKDNNNKLISEIIIKYHNYCNTNEYHNNLSIKNLCYYSSNFNKVYDEREGKHNIVMQNLFEGYNFARNNVITSENLQICHKIISKGILVNNCSGVFRDLPLFIKTNDIFNSYLLPSRYVVFCFNDLINHITKLLNKNLSNTETFYYSSLIHYVFLTIHPFWDFNGKIARLLEKWFLSLKLGEIFWLFPTEKYYFINKILYYRKLNIAQRNNEKIIDFLSIIPNMGLDFF